MVNPFDPAISGYPRDMVGYGRSPPDPKWPDGARLALNIVVNYEEGGEASVLHGDPQSVAFLTEHITTPTIGRRAPTAESLWEYGSRVGFWRVWRALSARKLATTCFGVTMAMARNPEAVAAMNEAGWEIATHGMRWNIDPPADEAGEAAEIAQTMALHAEITGAPARGWYNRSTARTWRLLGAHDMLYFADNYADDLPFWVDVAGRAELVVPYTLEANDMRFAVPGGFPDGDAFFTYLRDTFDVLYRDGLEGRPRMMSLGLHGRLAGRPGRTAALERFLDYVGSHERVWVASRAEIARHWRAHFPPPVAPVQKW